MEKTCFSKGKTVFFTLICCFLRVKISFEVAVAQACGASVGGPRNRGLARGMALGPFEVGHSLGFRTTPQARWSLARSIIWAANG